MRPLDFRITSNSVDNRADIVSLHEICLFFFILNGILKIKWFYFAEIAIGDLNILSKQHSIQFDNKV